MNKRRRFKAKRKRLTRRFPAGDCVFLGEIYPLVGSCVRCGMFSWKHRHFQPTEEVLEIVRAWRSEYGLASSALAVQALRFGRPVERNGDVVRVGGVVV